MGANFELWELVATKFVNDSKPGEELCRPRSLCINLMQAVYRGNENKAEKWRCERSPDVLCVPRPTPMVLAGFGLAPNYGYGPILCNYSFYSTTGAESDIKMSIVQPKPKYEQYDQIILFGDSITQMSSSQEDGFGLQAALQDSKPAFNFLARTKPPSVYPTARCYQSGVWVC